MRARGSAYHGYLVMPSTVYTLAHQALLTAHQVIAPLDHVEALAGVGALFVLYVCALSSCALSSRQLFGDNSSGST